VEGMGMSKKVKIKKYILMSKKLIKR
jgi:hypothetical protein